MIHAISPLDGRYQGKVQQLSVYFSEAALIRHRVEVECRWLQHLNELLKLGFTATISQKIEALAVNVTDAQVEEIKKIESKTNHDVKAVEYFIVEQMRQVGATDKEVAWVHFGCTSEDINNVSYALMIDRFLKKAWFPQATTLHSALTRIVEDTKSIPMLSRTHGQTASPSTLGKELATFLYRLDTVYNRIQRMQPRGKFSGAVGNYNAHHICYPSIDWQKSSSDFLDSLGVKQLLLTSQIENHDWLAELFSEMVNYQTIILDLCRDIWSYISIGYLTQKKVAGEVGSSTMPHKVNPIDFENAEGNLGLSNAILTHLQQKLPISRMQRDLSDSTVLRNVGVGFGYGFLASVSTVKGLSKISANKQKMLEDLDQSWEVLAEPIQMVLRTCGHADAYEKLKSFSRGVQITKKDYAVFIEGLGLPSELHERLIHLTPSTYIGVATSLVDQMFGEKNV